MRGAHYFLSLLFLLGTLLCLARTPQEILDSDPYAKDLIALLRPKPDATLTPTERLELQRTTLAFWIRQTARYTSTTDTMPMRDRLDGDSSKKRLAAILERTPTPTPSLERGPLTKLETLAAVIKDVTPDKIDLGDNQKLRDLMRDMRDGRRRSGIEGGDRRDDDTSHGDPIPLPDSPSAPKVDATKEMTGAVQLLKTSLVAMEYLDLMAQPTRTSTSTTAAPAADRTTPTPDFTPTVASTLTPTPEGTRDPSETREGDRGGAAMVTPTGTPPFPRPESPSGTSNGGSTRTPTPTPSRTPTTSNSRTPDKNDSANKGGNGSGSPGGGSGGGGGSGSGSGGIAAANIPKPEITSNLSQLLDSMKIAEGPNILDTLRTAAQVTTASISGGAIPQAVFRTASLLTGGPRANTRMPAQTGSPTRAFPTARRNPGGSGGSSGGGAPVVSTQGGQAAVANVGPPGGSSNSATASPAPATPALASGFPYSAAPEYSGAEGRDPNSRTFAVGVAFGGSSGEDGDGPSPGDQIVKTASSSINPATLTPFGASSATPPRPRFHRSTGHGILDNHGALLANCAHYSFGLCPRM